MPRRSPRPARARLTALLLAALVGLPLSACTDAPAPAADPVPTTVRDGTTLVPIPQARTTAVLGRVTGDLRPRRRQPLRQAVRHSVDRWLDAAYVERSYPRRRFRGAFAEFSDGAAREARHDRALLSNAAVASRVTSVRARRRHVSIDVLARAGRPVGVTAHVLLAQRLRGDGSLDRVERVTADLYMTRTRVGTVRTPRGTRPRMGWQVFGYDVQRGRVS